MGRGFPCGSSPHSWLLWWSAWPASRQQLRVRRIRSLWKGVASVYSVLYADDASLSAARAAVRAAGGTIVQENLAVRLARVRSTNARFMAAVARQPALFGAARNVPVGRVPRLVQKGADVEQDQTLGPPHARPKGIQGGSLADPFSGLQWDMKMIHADADGSYATQLGDPRVLVGVIDTGIDGIAPGHRAELRRGAQPELHGRHPADRRRCADEPDGSCNDPADVDEGGHGTHVAGTIGAALNGLGIAGVAPNVTLVNIRAGQDSGYFFLQPTVNALTYAGDIGIDVVNMSYFIDPWLYNCKHNPADSPEAADGAAHHHRGHAAGPRLRASARRRRWSRREGNEHTDLGHPTTDDISPDYPPGTEYHRDVDNTCLDDADRRRQRHRGVRRSARRERKSYYSNYGVEQTDVSAPGGDRREFYGTPQYNAPENRSLSACPSSSFARGAGSTRRATRPRRSSSAAATKGCAGTTVDPGHVDGLAARGRGRGPDRQPVRRGRPEPSGRPDDGPGRGERSAVRHGEEHACPKPRLFHYPDPDLPPCTTTRSAKGRRVQRVLRPRDRETRWPR